MLEIAPHRYQSAAGALQQLGTHLESLCERAFVIGNKTALDRFEDVIRSSLKESMIGVAVDVCLGECCLPEIERLVDKAKKEEADMIVGIGAGKTLDVSKYVAERSEHPLVTVPTVASSAAAFTNFVYLYNEDGDFIKEDRLDTCADLVVVDYKIIGRAGREYMTAGMANALSSSYEFSLSREELESNHIHQIAYRLTNHVREVVLSKGQSVLDDVRRGELTSLIETMIEVNILEAGLVHTLGGTLLRATLSHHIAHQLIPFTADDRLFGDVVAFGVLAQQMYKGSQPESYRELLEFFRDVDLPLTLDSLGLPENQRDSIIEDAAEGVQNQLRDHPVTFDIDSELLVESIWDADALGQTVIQSGIEDLEEF